MTSITPIQMSLESFEQLTTAPTSYQGNCITCMEQAEADRLLSYPLAHEIFLTAAYFYLATGRRDSTRYSPHAQRYQLCADAVSAAIRGTGWNYKEKENMADWTAYVLSYYVDNNSFSGRNYVDTEQFVRSMQAHKFHFLVLLSILTDPRNQA